MSGIKPAELAKLFGEKLQSSDLTMPEGKALGLVSSNDLKKDFGESFPPHAGFKIPYFDINGAPLAFFRVRLLQDIRSNAELLQGRKAIRYLQAPNSPAKLYIPPNHNWRKTVSDIEIPLIVTEGELKAACACRHNFAAVGLGGVWSFGSSKRGVQLLPEFLQLGLAGRRVVMAFDSDAITNVQVLKAENALAVQLLGEKARVYIARLPALNETGSKTGIDDYIKVKGAEAFQTAVLDSAVAFDTSRALHELNSEVVYIRSLGMVYSYADERFWSPHDFKHHGFSTLKVNEIRISGTKVVTLSVKAAEKWLDWPGRSELAGVTYKPGAPAVTAERLLNTWNGWGVASPRKGDVTPWNDMLDHLFSGASAGERRWFECWCAYPIQHPGFKLATAVLIWGLTQGTGKTLLGKCLMQLYGTNSTELKDYQIENPRNEWAEKKQFVLADDITGNESRKHANRLKTMITQREVYIDRKYVPTFSVPDCINYLFTSNSPDALFLESGDRRFFVHRVTAKKLPQNLRDRFVAWYQSEEGMASLFDHLSRLDLRNFDPHAEAMITHAKSAMSQAGKSALGAWISRLNTEPTVVLGNGQDLGDFRTAEEIRARFDNGNYNQKVHAGTVAKEMEKAGFVRVVVKCKDGSDSFLQKQVFVIFNEEKWRNASEKQLEEHFYQYRPQKVQKIAASATPDLSGIASL